MNEFTATTGASAVPVEARLKFDAVPITEPTRRLFDVEVDGLMGFSLIPLTDLARDLAGAWLHGTLKTTLCGITSQRPSYAPSSASPRTDSMRVDRLRLVCEPGSLLSRGGDPFYTGQGISEDERIVALAAIEAHRTAKRESEARAAKNARRKSKP